MDKNVAKRFDGIDKKIDDKINDVYKNMRGEFGKIYEIIARNEIGKKYRQHYSEEFNVYDLNGLVRIIAPKDQILPQENMDYDSQAYIMDHRADKIARYIYMSDKEKIPKNFYLKKLIAIFIFVTE
ncbi:uncharacterized protein OCT59_028182 [Rhizophagus irregularis]|uniref:Uncharacterized protein n=2 Tax=Rhizophagus irregularis TaxID=588596 RepID=A0A916E0W4_9GLOM|nr:hypothetical protein RirG_101030 [Rhizophagus irregularis DAOM 197198w]UZO07912.1 hypothetical protein OCT59_028182 [Rhizophagus irregularis]CAB4473264.1 unnamed protein product [Rhizophagus irregularis]CAB5153680.1 unnamed protein product [Rhizophagus irregularis]CAB5339535.1 unnamed protein product [Rhizophagus irregularis]